MPGKKGTAAELMAAATGEPTAAAGKRGRAGDNDDGALPQSLCKLPCLNAASTLSATLHELSPRSDCSGWANKEPSPLPLTSLVSSAGSDQAAAVCERTVSRQSSSRSGSSSFLATEQTCSNSISCDDVRLLPLPQDGARMEGVAVPCIAGLPAAREEWSAAATAEAAPVGARLPVAVTLVDHGSATPATAAGAVEMDQPLAVTERGERLESTDPACPGTAADAAATASDSAATVSAATGHTRSPCLVGPPFISLVQQSGQDLSKPSSGMVLKSKCSEEKVQPLSMEELLPENVTTIPRADVSHESEKTASTKPTDSEADSPPKFTRIDESMMLCKPSNKTPKMAGCECCSVKDGQQSDDHPCCGSETCVDAALLIECSRDCVCDASCANRRFQRRQYAELELFKTHMKGWGLRSRHDLPSGQFALEYVGEVVDRKEFRKRTQKYARNQHQHHYFMELDKERMIDATIYGNNSRFINHSCDPNCEIQKWLVGRDFRMGFFTCRPVTAGEELTFDYNLVLYGEELQKCHCGAPNCRGTIGTGKQLSLVTSKMKKKGKKDNSTGYKYMSKIDLEIARLSEVCKSEHSADDRCPKSLGLARLMTHAENVEQLQELLQILQGAHEKCRRMFLGVRGLECIWCFACDQAIKGNKTDEFRIQVVKALSTLPVQTKNAVQDTKVLSLMQRWSQELAERNQLAAAGDCRTLTAADVAAAAVQAAGDPARPLAATASEDSSTSAEEVAAGSVIKIGDIASADDACSVPSVPGQSPASAGTADCSRSAALATQSSTEPAEGSHPEADPSALSNNASEASSPAEQAAAVLAGLLDELLDHWSKLKEVFKIPKKQQAEEQQKTDVRIKPEPVELAQEDSMDDSGGYNRPRKSRRDFGGTKDDTAGSGWDAAGPQVKAESGRERSRSYGRSSRLHSDGGDRKRRHEPALGGQRSHSRTSKSARFSRPAGSALTKEQTRRQFEADVRAKDLLRKAASKDRTSSTSSEATPVAPASQPSGDTGSVLLAVAATQPPPSAASCAVVAPPPPPRIALAGSSSMSQQPVPGSFVDNAVYGHSHGFSPAIPLPPVLTARPPPAAPHPAAAAAYQQQQHLPVNMPGQHYGAAYPTGPPPPPIAGGVFSMPSYGSVFGTAAHGAGAYGMTGMPLPPAGAPYSGMPLGGASYGAGPMAAAYGPPLPLVAGYNPLAVSSGYSVAPPPADPSRTVTPVVYQGGQYMQPPVMPQQPQVIQQSVVINRPGLQPGMAALSVLPQVRPSPPVLQRNLPPVSMAATAPGARGDDDKPPPPPAPPRREFLVLPSNWKAAQDSEGKTYYYHTVTRQTQWDLPALEAPAPADPGTPTVDEPKPHKKVRAHSSAHHVATSSKSTTRAAADTSSAEGSGSVRDLKHERLRDLKQELSICIRSCLNAYMRPSCRAGRIENKDDYRHLAKKLTYGIMEKESKQCERMEDLEVNDVVKSKTKAYIKNYMEKFGEVYRRPRQDDL